jgi:hypothetical protein
LILHPNRAFFAGKLADPLLHCISGSDSGLPASARTPVSEPEEAPLH